MKKGLFGIFWTSAMRNIRRRLCTTQGELTPDRFGKVVIVDSLRAQLSGSCATASGVNGHGRRSNYWNNHILDQHRHSSEFHHRPCPYIRDVNAQLPVSHTSPEINPPGSRPSSFPTRVRGQINLDCAPSTFEESSPEMRLQIAAHSRDSHMKYRLQAESAVYIIRQPKLMFAEEHGLQGTVTFDILRIFIFVHFQSKKRFTLSWYHTSSFSSWMRGETNFLQTEKLSTMAKLTSDY